MRRRAAGASPMSKQKSSSHKKQHFVPQCYTKAWCDPASIGKPKVDPYVWVFDRGGSNPRRRSPSNLFTETDIYTMRSPDGSRDLRLEHGFQELEDKFTRIRNLTFSRGRWPDAEQTAWLLAFVATSQARTASHRDHHREQWAKLREKMEAMERAHRTGTPRQREAIERMSAGVPSTGGRIGLEEVRAIEANPIQHTIGPVLAAVMPIYGRMSIAVLCADDPIGFVTTDRPCTWFDPEGYKLPPIYRGPGLAFRTIEVTLPISPSQCVVLTHNPELQGFLNVDQAAVDAMNNRHIAHCGASFISRSPDTRLHWFTRPEMPEDAWEKVRERKIASGEWPTPRLPIREEPN